MFTLTVRVNEILKRHFNTHRPEIPREVDLQLREARTAYGLPEMDWDDYLAYARSQIAEGAKVRKFVWRDPIVYKVQYLQRIIPLYWPPDWRKQASNFVQELATAAQHSRSAGI